MNIGTILGSIELDDKASGALKSFGVNLKDGTIAADKFGAGVTRAGGALSAFVSLPLAGAAAASLSFSAAFESSMTKLVSLAGVGAGDLGMVKQAILDLAPAVGIGPQALADAMTKISSTVEGAQAGLDILKISAMGSAAGMGQAVDVAGALTSVVNSYAKSGLSASRAADILTVAIKDGGAEAKELAPTLSNVVPFAAQLGVSFEEVAANLATFTKLGSPAAEAVTTLSSVMTAMVKETRKGTDALKSVGLSYAELRQEIKDRGLAATLTDLSERFKGNETGLVQVFGRIEAVRNIMGTAATQAETYSDVLGHVTDSAGKLQGAFDAIKGTQAQTWHEVIAQVQAVAIQLGDSLAPTMITVLNTVKPLISGVSEMVKWFGDLPGPVQTVAIALGALLTAAGPILVIAGQLISAWASVAPVLTIVSKGFLALSAEVGGVAVVFNPVVLTIAAVTAGAIALYEALDHFNLIGPIVDFFRDLSTVVSGTLVSGFNTAKSTIQDVAAIVKGDFESSFRDVKSTIQDVATAVTGDLTAGFRDAHPVLSKFSDYLSGPLREGFKFYIADAKAGASVIVDWATKIKDWLLPKLDELRTNLGFLADSFRMSGEVDKLEKNVSKLGLTFSTTNPNLKSTDELLGKYSQGLGITNPKVLEAAKHAETLSKETLKQQDAMAKANAEIMRAHQTVGQLTEKQKAFVIENQKLGLSVNIIAAALGTTSEAVKTFEDSLKVDTKIKEIEHSTTNFAESLGKIGRSFNEANLGKLADEIGKAEQSARLAAFGMGSLNEGVEKVGVSFQKTGDEADKFARFEWQGPIQDHVVKAVDSLKLLSEAFVQLGQIGGRAMGPIFETIGGMIVQLKTAQTSAAETGSHFGILGDIFRKDATGVDRFASAMAAAAVVAKGAIEVWDATGSHATAAGNALGGAAAGAKAGAAFGPYGIAIGAAAGLIVGLIRGKPDWAKAADEVGADFGAKISNSLAKEIADSAKKDFGGSRQAAALNDLSKIIKETGGLSEATLPKMTDRLRDVFVMVETHQFTIAQGAKVINENWNEFVQTSTDGLGLLSPKLVEMIGLNDRLGTGSKAIADYVANQLTNAERGFSSALQVTSDAYAKRAEIQSKITTATGADLEKLNAQLLVQQGIIDATGIHSQDSAQAVAASLVGIVSSNMAAGKSFIDAIRGIGPDVVNLQAQLTAMGFSGGAAFDFINEQVTLANNEIAGPALVAVEGFTAGMVGLSNAGRLNQDTFAGLAGQIAQTEASLVAQGFSGSAVMAAMQNDLQTIWKLQQDYNFKVDETTQKLIDEAVESGLVGEQHKTDSQKMVDSLSKVVDKLDQLLVGMGITLPKVVDNAAAVTQDRAGRMVDSWREVSEAVDSVNFGNSPGGIKEIPILLDRANTALMITGGFAENVFGGMEDSIYRILTATDGWTGSLSDVNTQLDAIARNKALNDLQNIRSTPLVGLGSNPSNTPTGSTKSTPLVGSDLISPQEIHDMAVKAFEGYFHRLPTTADLYALGSAAGYTEGEWRSKEWVTHFLQSQEALNAILNESIQSIGRDVGAVQYHARGGIVTDTAQYKAVGGTVTDFPGRARGTDTEPVWMTPREGVVTTQGMDRIGVKGLQEINDGTWKTSEMTQQEIKLLRHELKSVLKDSINTKSPAVTNNNVYEAAQYKPITNQPPVVTNNTNNTNNVYEAAQYKPISDKLPIVPPTVTNNNVYEAAEYKSTGGVITDIPQYKSVGGSIANFPGGPRGTDTEPVWMTPREGIVTTQGMASLGEKGLQAINDGTWDNGEMTQQELRLLRREIKLAFEDLPDRLARSTRDEVQKVRRR